ncbi:hypothetical protein ACTJJB_00665 [Chitinophaga sp. 22536]|uniref:hypothetical protein n=1 Tax=unclassified Chitinophaga TaxID=2619133 RepID=UPI003F87E5AE
MKQTILDKITKLGGNIQRANGATLQDIWQGITFSHPLWTRDWEGFGLDEFYEEHKALYNTSPDTFYDNLLAHYFSDHEIPYGQDFFRSWLFTPFKAGSGDEGELDGLVEEEEVRAVVKGNDMEFMCIFSSYGFPDHYFVCLTDPDPENPIVYSTDHEVYFQEIDNKGTLEDFLEKYMTKDEFLQVAKRHIESGLTSS